MDACSSEIKVGPFVLLLHGFHETWFSWRHQMAHLASHGYHVVAPDLRGYGESDSPVSPSSYTNFHIVGDLIGLLDHCNQQQFISILNYICVHVYVSKPFLSIYIGTY